MHCTAMALATKFHDTVSGHVYHLTHHHSPRNISKVVGEQPFSFTYTSLSHSLRLTKSFVSSSNKKLLDLYIYTKWRFQSFCSSPLLQQHPSQRLSITQMATRRVRINQAPTEAMMV